jgi:hypothetical protein
MTLKGAGNEFLNNKKVLRSDLKNRGTFLKRYYEGLVKIASI